MQSETNFHNTDGHQSRWAESPGSWLKAIQTEKFQLRWNLVPKVICGLQKPWAEDIFPKQQQLITASVTNKYSDIQPAFSLPQTVRRTFANWRASCCVRLWVMQHISNIPRLVVGLLWLKRCLWKQAVRLCTAVLPLMKCWCKAWHSYHAGRKVTSSNSTGPLTYGLDLPSTLSTCASPRQSLFHRF